MTVEPELDYEEMAKAHSGVQRCPICDKTFTHSDLCAVEISEGICHAKCLEDAPIVDPSTGYPTESGKLRTFIYSDEYVLVPRDACYNPGIINAVYAEYAKNSDIKSAFSAGVAALLEYHSRGHKP